MGGLTQAQAARTAGVSDTTWNQGVQLGNPERKEAADPKAGGDG